MTLPRSPENTPLRHYRYKNTIVSSRPVDAMGSRSEAKVPTAHGWIRRVAEWGPGTRNVDILVLFLDAPGPSDHESHSNKTMPLGLSHRASGFDVEWTGLLHSKTWDLTIGKPAAGASQLPLPAYSQLNLDSSSWAVGR